MREGGETLLQIVVPRRRIALLEERGGAGEDRQAAAKPRIAKRAVHDRWPGHAARDRGGHVDDQHSPLQLVRD